MQGLTTSEALDEGLIDFDDLFPVNRGRELSPSQEEEYRLLTEQWELEASLAAAEASDERTIKF